MRIIAGSHRGRRLIAPVGGAIRPTSDRAREALFDILDHDQRRRGRPGLMAARFLDLFCGSGAVGLEAWSRGATEILLIDHDPAAVRLARANLARLGEPAGVRVQAADATRLGKAPTPFDLAFLDPPYGTDLAVSALVALQQGWLATDARVVVELAAKAALALPKGYEIERERRYGAARFLLLTPVHAP